MGKSIDRNIIIVILYNLSCGYQGLWKLDKCKKYLDGVIFNIEMIFEEEENQGRNGECITRKSHIQLDSGNNSRKISRI